MKNIECYFEIQKLQIEIINIRLETIIWNIAGLMNGLRLQLDEYDSHRQESIRETLDKIDESINEGNKKVYKFAGKERKRISDKYKGIK